MTLHQPPCSYSYNVSSTIGVFENRSKILVKRSEEMIKASRQKETPHAVPVHAVRNLSILNLCPFAYPRGDERIPSSLPHVEEQFAILQP